MPERTASSGGLTVFGDGMRAVAELDRAEREAIEAGDWARLQHVLERQRALWRELTRAAGSDANESVTALKYLYSVRRRNHQLIAARAEAMRRRLVDAGWSPPGGSDRRTVLDRAA